MCFSAYGMTIASAKITEGVVSRGFGFLKYGFQGYAVDVLRFRNTREFDECRENVHGFDHGMT